MWIKEGINVLNSCHMLHQHPPSLPPFQPPFLAWPHFFLPLALPTALSGLPLPHLFQGLS